MGLKPRKKYGPKVSAHKDQTKKRMESGRRGDKLTNGPNGRSGEEMSNKKGKKQLLSSAPWRVEDDGGDSRKFSEAKLKVTNQPGQTPTMHVPRKKGNTAHQDEDESALDPELRYSFHRNYKFLQRVFSIDTIVKPLPPAMAYNVSRNLSFFTRIFTQFFDPEGIANAQKSLGLGQEEKARRVR